MERHPNSVATLMTWAQANEFGCGDMDRAEAASNFYEPNKMGRSRFRLAAAIRYLEALDEKNVVAALRTGCARGSYQAREDVHDLVLPRW